MVKKIFITYKFNITLRFDAYIQTQGDILLLYLRYLIALDKIRILGKVYHGLVVE